MGHRREELGREAGLAQPRLPHHGGDLHTALAYGTIECIDQAAELLISSHHRRIQPAQPARRALDHLEETPGGHGLSLSLEGQWLHRLGQNGVAHQPVGAVADEDLPRLCGLLEPGRHVGGVA